MLFETFGKISGLRSKIGCVCVWGARLIRNFDKQKRKKEKEEKEIRSFPNGYVLLPKKCVCV